MSVDKVRFAYEGHTHSGGSAGPAGAGYASTVSTSSVTISTGSTAFTVGDVGAYVAGQRVRVVSSASPTNYLEGEIASIVGLVVTVTVDRVAGAGTFAAWTFAVAGEVGAAGASGSGGGVSNASLFLLMGG